MFCINISPSKYLETNKHLSSFINRDCDLAKNFTTLEVVRQILHVRYRIAVGGGNFVKPAVVTAWAPVTRRLLGHHV